MTIAEIFPIARLGYSELCGLVPLMSLGIAAIAILLVSRFEESTSRVASIGLLVVGCLVALATLFGKCPSDPHQAANLLGGVFVSDIFSKFFSSLVIVSTLCSGLMATSYLRRESISVEYFSLLLFASIGGILLVSTEDLLTVFIGIELLSLATYVLVCMRRTSQGAAEAGLKYFITGGVASAVFLYGVTLLYGSSGSMNVRDIFESYQSVYSGTPPLMTLVGAFLVSVGLLFKLGAVPFHVWVPDVYTGASTTVTGYMITAVKVAGFGLLLRVGEFVFAGPDFTERGDFFYILIWTVTALSLIWGALAGALQQNLKRMLAYSTLTHTGFMLLGFLTYSGAGSSAFGPICNYLVVYTAMNLGLFAILTMISREGDNDLELNDLTGLFNRSPSLAIALSVFLLSLAGIPPAAGFFGKFFLINEAANSGEYLLGGLAVLASILSVYYYIRPMVYIFAGEKTPATRTTLAITRGTVAGWMVAMVACMVVLALGIVPLRF